MDGFAGQVAVITGAASGIGRALAFAAAQRGMHLLLADKDLDGLERLRGELSCKGQRILVQDTDVTRPDSVTKLARTAIQEFEEIQLLFNNAGICPMGLLWDMDSRDWQAAIDVNLMGVVNGINAFLPLLMTQNSRARVVNTGSIAGLFSNPGGMVYGVTKHAVVALSEGLFLELQQVQSRVSVSVICPGFVRTNLGRSAEETGQSAIPESTRLGFQALEKALAEGMSPETLADIVFTDISADKFWIFPQPDLLSGFELRATSIRQQTDPRFVQILH